MLSLHRHRSPTVRCLSSSYKDMFLLGHSLAPVENRCHEGDVEIRRDYSTVCSLAPTTTNHILSRLKKHGVKTACRIPGNQQLAWTEQDALSIHGYTPGTKVFIAQIVLRGGGANATKVRIDQQKQKQVEPAPSRTLLKVPLTTSPKIESQSSPNFKAFLQRRRVVTAKGERAPKPKQDRPGKTEQARDPSQHAQENTMTMEMKIRMANSTQPYHAQVTGGELGGPKSDYAMGQFASSTSAEYLRAVETIPSNHEYIYTCEEDQRRREFLEQKRSLRRMSYNSTYVEWRDFTTDSILLARQTRSAIQDLIRYYTDEISKTSPCALQTVSQDHADRSDIEIDEFDPRQVEYDTYLKRQAWFEYHEARVDVDRANLLSRDLHELRLLNMTTRFKMGWTGFASDSGPYSLLVPHFWKMSIPWLVFKHRISSSRSRIQAIWLDWHMLAQWTAPQSPMMITSEMLGNRKFISKLPPVLMDREHRPFVDMRVLKMIGMEAYSRINNQLRELFLVRVHILRLAAGPMSATTFPMRYGLDLGRDPDSASSIDLKVFNTMVKLVKHTTPVQDTARKVRSEIRGLIRMLRWRGFASRIPSIFYDSTRDSSSVEYQVDIEDFHWQHFLEAEREDAAGLLDRRALLKEAYRTLRKAHREENNYWKNPEAGRIPNFKRRMIRAESRRSGLGTMNIAHRRIAAKSGKREKAVGIRYFISRELGSTDDKHVPSRGGIDDKRSSDAPEIRKKGHRGAIVMVSGTRRVLLYKPTLRDSGSSHEQVHKRHAMADTSTTKQSARRKLRARAKANRDRPKADEKGDVRFAATGTAAITAKAKVKQSQTKANAGENNNSRKQAEDFTMSVTTKSNASKSCTRSKSSKKDGSQRQVKNGVMASDTTTTDTSNVSKSQAKVKPDEHNPSQSHFPEATITTTKSKANKSQAKSISDKPNNKQQQVNEQPKTSSTTTVTTKSRAPLSMKNPKPDKQLKGHEQKTEDGATTLGMKITRLTAKKEEASPSRFKNRRFIPPFRSMSSKHIKDTENDRGQQATSTTMKSKESPAEESTPRNSGDIDEQVKAQPTFTIRSSRSLRAQQVVHGVAELCSTNICQEVNDATAGETMGPGDEEERPAEKEEGDSSMDGSFADGPESPGSLEESEDASEGEESGSEFNESESDAESSSESDSEVDEDHVPLLYQIPERTLQRAVAKPATEVPFYFDHTLYRGPNDEMVRIHYCRNKTVAENALKHFRDASVLGFDIEWKPNAFPSAGPRDNASLIQLASESRIGLFHVALWKNEKGPELLPAALKEILESEQVRKVGVSILADTTRLLKYLGVKAQGLVELSHLHKLVTLSANSPHLVNKRLVSLATQVQEHLHLPLSKGEVRESDWSKELNREQMYYAATDAYAGLRVYDVLEAKRKKLKPKPPHPAFAESRLPITLAKGVKVTKPAVRREAKAESATADAKDEEYETAPEEQFDAEAHDGSRSDSESSEAVKHLGKLNLNLGNASSTSPEPLYPILPALSQDSTMPSQELDLGVDSNKMDTDMLSVASTWETMFRAERSTDSPLQLKSAALQAYHLWHHQTLDLKAIGALLREKPLAESTVAKYLLDCVLLEKLPYKSARVQEALDKVPGRIREWRYRRVVAWVKEEEEKSG